MRIMGIDPGLNKTGIAVLEKNNSNLTLNNYRLVKPKGNLNTVEKIDYLISAIYEIITEFEPAYAAIEDSFYSVNVKTAINLGVARGAILASLLQKKIKVYQFTALQIKKAVVGYGKADKNQVKKMVELQLNINLDNQPNDISDAIACAMCLGFHLNGVRHV